ncbi:hypothetical protein PMIT1323_00102 [Prochlorococcus marinus str. MIT 1323]|nr:hypothetical protein PMIT1323_00102 [Prochlorococcus marinus str. MIT 1323]
MAIGTLVAAVYKSISLGIDKAIVLANLSFAASLNWISILNRPCSLVLLPVCLPVPLCRS